MKIPNNPFWAGATSVALSLSLVQQIQAQTTSSGDRLADPQTSTVDHSSTVSKVNKASSLLGMDVRNTANEKLGDIKDLVVDLQSGKIAYAVLGVGGFLGIGDKYIAVPPNAFTVAPDQDKLVLNADKAKIQNAPGFAKSSWPDLKSPSWETESAYWTGDATARGTVGAVRSETATEGHPLTVSPDRRDLTTVDREVFHGQITAIDPVAKTMTVKGPSGSRDFKIVERPTITLKDSRNPHLVDLKVGYPVTVGYHEENGTYVAHSIIRSDTPEVK